MGKYEKNKPQDNRDIFEKALDSGADIEAARWAMAAPFLAMAARSVVRGHRKIMRSQPPGVPVGAMAGLTGASAVLHSTSEKQRSKRRRK